MHGGEADDVSGGEPTGNGAAAENGASRHGSGMDAPRLQASVDEAATTIPTVSRATVRNLDAVEGASRIASILVAVGPGPHSGATVDLGRRLAETTDAWLDLFHVVTDGSVPDEDAEPTAATGTTLLATARDRIEGFERADRFLLEGDSAGTVIAEQSPYYDLVVVGAPTTGTVGRFVLGCTTDTVVEDAAVPVVVVETDEPTWLR